MIRCATHHGPYIGLFYLPNKLQFTHLIQKPERGCTLRFILHYTLLVHSVISRPGIIHTQPYSSRL